LTAASPERPLAVSTNGVLPVANSALAPTIPASVA
jgi:hypothetical protein